MILKPLTEWWFLFQRTHSQKEKSEQNSCYVKLFRLLKCLWKDECFFKLIYALKNPPRITRTYTGLGKQILGGHKQKLMHTRTQEKGSVTPQETDPDLPVSVQESPAEVWVGGGLLQGWGTECISVCMRPFESGCHYFHYLLHSLASGQITRKEHSLAYQQTIGLKIYWAWPRPSEQDPVSPSVSLSHQEASISLLSFSIRGQTDWKPQSHKINQSNHVEHSLV